MTKVELVKAVSEKASMTQKQAADAIEAVVATIEEVLVAKQELQLKGFGTFYISERPARQGRNPKTGEPVKIGAKNIAKFKFSAEIKKKLN